MVERQGRLRRRLRTERPGAERAQRRAERSHDRDDRFRRRRRARRGRTRVVPDGAFAFVEWPHGAAGCAYGGRGRKWSASPTRFLLMRVGVAMALLGGCLAVGCSSLLGISNLPGLDGGEGSDSGTGNGSGGSGSDASSSSSETESGTNSSSSGSGSGSSSGT